MTAAADVVVVGGGVAGGALATVLARGGLDVGLEQVLLTPAGRTRRGSAASKGGFPPTRRRLQQAAHVVTLPRGSFGPEAAGRRHRWFDLAAADPMVLAPLLAHW